MQLNIIFILLIALHNAVGETKIDSNGKTYTVNSDRWNIDKLKMITITNFASNNFEIISKCDNLKLYIVSYMKKKLSEII